MILEVAILELKVGQQDPFEKNSAIAQDILSAAKGHISHEPQLCVEKLIDIYF